MTGASGYIGGRLVESLYSDGMKVKSGSRHPPAGSLGLDWVHTDFESAVSLEEACDGCDSIVHLASLNEMGCVHDPKEATVANTINTQALAEAARNTGTPRIIFFSTVHVYGSPLRGVLTESSPCEPAHPYSISHKAAEDYLRFSASTGGPEAIVVRLSNSFGYPVRPGVDRWTLVLNDACRQLASTGKVVLKSSGTQVRDFIALGDVCRATELLLETAVRKSGYEVYNLGGDWTASILEIVELAVAAYTRITGRSAEIERPDGTSTGGEGLRIDVSKLRALGFVPSSDHDVEIRGLMERCLEWFPRTPGA